MSRPRREKESKKPTSVASRLRRLMGPAIIVMAAVIAAAPLIMHGPSCSGDLVFHFISWLDGEHSMSTGLLYPHWANSPNFGAGEPRFVFYPPISWMAGAVLGTFLRWSFVPLALFILFLAATGLANRALALEVLEDPPATLAGCAAIFLGYALFNIYKRNDFAELTGGFWIPLLLLFALRRRNPSGNFWERTFDGSAAPLALIVAGIWLSNGPLGIMASYLLAAVALASALIEKSMVPIARAAAGTVAGMGLASLYLIPAISERNCVSIRNAMNSTNYAVENNWLFAHHADPLLASHDILLHRVSNVAVAMLVITFLGGAIAWIRGVVPGERRWWLPMALIPPVVLFLLFPVSQPVWNLLPELRLLQFPWRWLVVLESPMAIGFASALWFNRKPLRILVMTACAALFVAISLVIPRWWFVECGPVMTLLQDSARKGIIVLGKPEYAPPGIRYPLVDPQGNPLVDPQGNPLLAPPVNPNVQMMPSACLLDSASNAAVQEGAPAWDGEPASCKSSRWRQMSLMADPSAPEASRYMPEQKWFMGIAEHAGYLILRLRYYPAWGVKVNGIPVTAMAERERGLMAVPIPAGNVQVSVNWTTTGDVIAGRLVSAVALLLIAGIFLFERKQSNVERTHSLPSVPRGPGNSPPYKPRKTARRK